MTKFKTIQLPVLAQMLGKDDDATRKWCIQNDIRIYKGEKSDFVFYCHAESVWLANIFFHLKNTDPIGWREKLNEYLK